MHPSVRRLALLALPLAALASVAPALQDGPAPQPVAGVDARTPGVATAPAGPSVAVAAAPAAPVTVTEPDGAGTGTEPAPAPAAGEPALVETVAAASDAGPRRAEPSAPPRAEQSQPGPDTDARPSDVERSPVEAAAVATADQLGAVPTRPGAPSDPGRLCPAERLTVSWDAPQGTFTTGGHIEPLGPAPTDTTTAVNGVVLCEGATYAYMGFEAIRAGGTWQILPVPTHTDAAEHTTLSPALPGDGDVYYSVPEGYSVPLSFSSRIDAYTTYEPQKTCSPTVKPGTGALRDMLLTLYPATGSYGIVRSCDAGGTSEHKEGRAFDWKADVSNPAQKAAVQHFITTMLATDSAGNRHALARRMGIMYVIWNRQIWSAYRISEGWRPYTGASPHTDHMHISMSWDGALGRTSFWAMAGR